MLDEEAEAPIEPWVGPYVILAHLADGGMGRAYLGRRMRSSELVVVKIRRQVDDPRFSAEILRRFAREGQVNARLRNRNIAALVDAKRDYLVFEHVAGPSLAMLMGAVFRNKRVVPAPIMARILKGLLAGLHHLHEARDEAGERLLAVHRDVTPGNVLISLDGVVKIIDLGLVRANAGGFRTEMKLVMGTAQYISPEVVSASGRPPDRRADIYAASVIAYEMLAGSYLLPPGSRLSQVSSQLGAIEIPPLASRGVLVPSDVEAVIRRGLSRQPGDRWATAHEMSMALGEAVGEAIVSEDAIAELVAPSSRAIRETRDHWIEVARNGLARELGGKDATDMFEPTRAVMLPPAPEEPEDTLVVRARQSAPPPAVEIPLESVLSGIEPPMAYERPELEREESEVTFAELPAAHEPAPHRASWTTDAVLQRPAPASRSRVLVPVVWVASVLVALVLGGVARDVMAPLKTDPIPPLADTPPVVVVPASDPPASEPPASEPPHAPDPPPSASSTPAPSRRAPTTPASPAAARRSEAAQLLERLQRGEALDGVLERARALTESLDGPARARAVGLLDRASMSNDREPLESALRIIDAATPR